MSNNHDQPENEILVLPTIHLNGTGAKMLAEGYEQAERKLSDFIDAFCNIEFNARDYYPQGPEAYEAARDRRYEIFKHIKVIKDYIIAHQIHIDDNTPKPRR